MSLYDNILTGMNTFSFYWLISIKKINKENLIIFDFNNDNLQNIIIEKNNFILEQNNIIEELKKELKKLN